jgi:DNA-binding transcriptional regulator YdaS (Cro superfamily)
MDTFQEALTFFGNQSRMARALGVTPQAIHQWRLRGQVPIEKALAIEIASNGVISKTKLRPDIFRDTERTFDSEAA